MVLGTLWLRMEVSVSRKYSGRSPSVATTSRTRGLFGGSATLAIVGTYQRNAVASGRSKGLSPVSTFGMLLKSYGQDFEYARRMIASFHQHNAEKLSLFVVVPESDLELFDEFADDTVIVLSELLLAEHLVSEPLNGYRPGYINQEIVKLSFWELGYLENYFCVDSEAVFIRDFGFQDFMADSTAPYTVLVEDKELQVEPRYYREHWIGRAEQIQHIADLLDYSSPVLRTCHGHQVFSSTVLESFVRDFLGPRGWTYRDALAEAPYEFSWYNLWLQKTQVIDIHQREPFVKVFHNEDQHIDAITRGVTMEDLARSYLAVVINSSYSRDVGIISPYASKPEAIAPYLSYGELARVAGRKVADTLSRRIGWTRRSQTE